MGVKINPDYVVQFQPFIQISFVQKVQVKEEINKTRFTKVTDLYGGEGYSTPGNLLRKRNSKDFIINDTTSKSINFRTTYPGPRLPKKIRVDGFASKRISCWSDIHTNSVYIYRHQDKRTRQSRSS